MRIVVKTAHMLQLSITLFLALQAVPATLTVEDRQEATTDPTFFKIADSCKQRRNIAYSRARPFLHFSS